MLAANAAIQMIASHFSIAVQWRVWCVAFDLWKATPPKEGEWTRSPSEGSGLTEPKGFSPCRKWQVGSAGVWGGGDPPSLNSPDPVLVLLATPVDGRSPLMDPELDLGQCQC